MANLYKALYLLAGAGTRLHPLTESTPKALLQLHGRPMISWSVDSMIECGIEDFVVVTGFEASKVRDYFLSSYSRARFEFFHNAEYSSTNNAYSLLLARPAFHGSAMLLLDGDVLFERDIALMMAGTEAPDNCLAVRFTDDLGDEEMKVIADSTGAILRIGKLIPPAESHGESIGIGRFSESLTSELFNCLQSRVSHGTGSTEFYEATFQELISTGVRISAVSTENFRCIEVDTHEDFACASDIVEGWMASEAEMTIRKVAEIL